MDEQKKVQSSLKFVKHITEFGDIVCPNCECRIITPKSFALKAGRASCPSCSIQFILSENTALIANEQKEKFFFRTLIGV